MSWTPFFLSTIFLIFWSESGGWTRVISKALTTFSYLIEDSQDKEFSSKTTEIRLWTLSGLTKSSKSLYGSSFCSRKNLSPEIVWMVCRLWASTYIILYMVSITPKIFDLEFLTSIFIWNWRHESIWLMVYLHICEEYWAFKNYLLIRTFYLASCSNMD